MVNHLLILFLLIGCTELPDSDPSSYCVGKRIYLAGPIASGGFLGGISGADSYCNSNKPTSFSTSTVKALIVATSRRACSTGDCSGGTGEHIDWVLAANNTYCSSNYSRVIGITNGVGLFSFPLSNAITTNASSIFTGLDSNWTTSGNPCTGWTATGGTAAGGDSSLIDANAVSGTVYSCGSTSNYLYCVEQ